MKNWVRIIYKDKSTQSIPCKRCSVDNLKRKVLIVDGMDYKLKEIEEVYFNDLKIY